MNKVLKQITLIVDEKFENEWLMNTATPSEISEVLKIGCTGYLGTRDIVIGEHLKNAENEKFKLIEMGYKKEKEDMKERYENKIETLIKRHEQEIEVHYGRLLEENKGLKGQIYEREDKLRKEYDEKGRE